jgi:molecular chaperone GrpE
MSENTGSKEGNKKEGEVEELRRLLEGAKMKNEETLTRLRYLQADFENYRKRSEKELREVEDASLRGLVVKLLSTLDELELAVKNAEQEGGREELLDGLRMVLGNLVSSLEAAGLSRIDSVGRPFDPTMHEAVEKSGGSSLGKEVVKEEIRPGYVFRGRVVRPSMVKVELAPEEPGGQEEKASE